MSIDLPDARVVTGSVQTPSGLGRPDMLLIEAKRKSPLDKQRAFWKTSLAAGKVNELQIPAQVLATQLYQASKNEKDEAKEQALLLEARRCSATRARSPPALRRS